MIDEKQVQEADAAVTRAVTAFVSEFESMWGRWENVAPGYVIESTLLDFWPPISRPSQDRRRRPWPPTGTLSWRPLSPLPQADDVGGPGRADEALGPSIADLGRRPLIAI